MQNDLQKLIAQKQLFIVLLKGINENQEKEYFYMAVRGDEMLRMHQMLRDAQGLGYFEPSDYGLIIEGGRGEPSNEVKQRMEKEYNYSHQKSVPIIINTEAA